MSDTSVAARLLAFLAANPPATARELAALLDVTPADIRYHIGGLVAAGRVRHVPAGSHGKPARGRPAARYTLALAHIPQNLPHLIDSLLKYMLRNHSIDEQEVALASIAALMAGEQSVCALTARFNRSTQWLNGHQYQARWEARRAGPVIILQNCPYLQLLDGHPELCRLDQHLIEHLTAMQARRISRIDPTFPHAGACVFQLT